MDRAYYTWLWLVGGGVVLGLFVTARAVAICAAACMAVAVVGLLVLAALDMGSIAMLFGIAAMVIPIAGALAWLGTKVGGAIRASLAKGGRT